MRKKLLPFVECWRDRHGKLRFYFRRARGRRLALPPVGSDEFQSAYEAALLGGGVATDSGEPVRPNREPIVSGTIAALIVSYKRSASYLSLRQTTKNSYGGYLDILRTKHGHRTVAGLSRDRIITGILQPYADRPGSAVMLLRILRILIGHAIDVGWLDRNPSLGIKQPKLQEVRAWTEAEIGRFEARWPIESRQRLAFALMLFSGQRRSDVYRMTWADVANGSLRVVQQKTGAKLTIPLHANLLAVLAAAKRQHIMIVTTEGGRAFALAGFADFMREAIKAAGLPLECRPHGLRKAAGRRLAECGCTAREIMAVLGHKSLSQAELYTRDADQVALAGAAVTKLQGREQSASRVAQTGVGGFGQIPKNQT